MTISYKISKLKLQNEELLEKRKKYNNTHFAIYFAILEVISIVVFNNMKVDQYISIIPNIPNSLFLSVTSLIISGSMLLTCKLEYMKSVTKIDKLLKKNNFKINQLEKEQVKTKKFVKTKHSNLETITEKIQKQLEQETLNLKTTSQEQNSISKMDRLKELRKRINDLEVVEVQETKTTKTKKLI